MKKVLILLNMGGPNNPDEVKIFLKNMFNDKNIITTKSVILRKFLAFMISSLRQKKAKQNYDKIGGFSPIGKYTQNLCDKIQANLKDEVIVKFAMRYTPPFAKDVLENLNLDEVDEIFALPMYPHFSTTTTKSSLEDMKESLEILNYKHKLSHILRFYKDEKYNEIIIKNIKKTLANHDANEYDLIFSAHSLPQKIIQNGDTYQQEIIEHVEILTKMLKNENINFNKITLAYQSKLGPIKWLEPELEAVLKAQINKKVIIYPISFTIDNSETEFELWQEYKHIADSLGFLEYKVSPCINADDDFVEFITQTYKSR